MQQHFSHKYSFQRVPNQVEKLRKFQGERGMTSTPPPHPWNGNSMQGVGGPGINVLSEGYGYFMEL